VNTTLRYLGTLDYSDYIPEFYDCEDIALWAVAHVRRRFPGSGIGIASGTALEGDLANKDHAILILWYAQEKDANDNITKVGYKFWDPVYSPNGPSEMDSFEVKSIVSFPLGTEIPPSNRGDLRILSNEALVFDEKRIMYKKEDLLGYLNNPSNISKIVTEDGEFRFWDDVNCRHLHNSNDHKQENNEDFLSRWKAYDTTLSAFVHARRKFKGCALGMAIGDVIGGVHSSAIIIWHESGESKELEYGYWSPTHPSANLNKNFVPRMIFV
jgi:hypothetical protein